LLTTLLLLAGVAVVAQMVVGKVVAVREGLELEHRSAYRLELNIQ
jgi:hypothetical protein